MLFDAAQHVDATHRHLRYFNALKRLVVVRRLANNTGQSYQTRPIQRSLFCLSETCHQAQAQTSIATEQELRKLAIEGFNVGTKNMPDTPGQCSSQPTLGTMAEARSFFIRRIGRVLSVDIPFINVEYRNLYIQHVQNACFARMRHTTMLEAYSNRIKSRVQMLMKRSVVKRTAYGV